MNFNEIIDQVLEHEGGDVNNPHDTGGETNYGIAKRWYPEVDIKNLNVDDAVNIYYNDYSLLLYIYLEHTNIVDSVFHMKSNLILPL